MAKWFLVGLFAAGLAACGGATKSNMSATNGATSPGYPGQPANATETVNSADANGQTGPTNDANQSMGNMSGGMNTALGNEAGNASVASNSTSSSGSIATGTSDDADLAAYCVNAGLTADACQSLQRQQRGLMAGVGSLAAETPVMDKGAEYTVTLEVGRERDAAVVQGRAETQAGTQSVSKTGEVQLAHRMRATLSGSGFAISPDGPVDQTLDPQRRASWRWRVTPDREGMRRLVATVTPLARLSDGTDLPLGGVERPLEVRVKVTAQQRMGSWESFFKSTTGVLVALAALIAAAGGMWWAVKKFGKDPQGE